MASIQSIATKSFDGQRPGTSGLRKRVKVFQQEHYTQNFIQATLEAIPTGAKGATLVVGGDGRYFSKDAVQMIIRIAAGNEASDFFSSLEDRVDVRENLVATSRGCIAYLHIFLPFLPQAPIPPLTSLMPYPLPSQSCRGKCTFVLWINVSFATCSFVRSCLFFQVTKLIIGQNTILSTPAASNLIRIRKATGKFFFQRYAADMSGTLDRSDGH
ncbi:Phosphoglucomutase-2 [Lunasporangiospora selenospora]|uniref:Phosphoglucomutase-2 n=1 Tax=Lunasporangiospora selenospora TaxID=979761 RepID=A0A9P6FXY3_9FUNG|nr:Phosphoglucomutase-2 [Lunasporangiospora selenospora]